MAEEEKTNSAVETVQKINPHGKFYFQFPEGMSDEEKASFDSMLEKAKEEGKNVYIEPAIKVVSMDDVGPAPEPKPEPEPIPEPEPVAEPAPAPEPVVINGGQYGQYQQPNPQQVYQQPTQRYITPQEQAVMYQYPQGGYSQQPYQQSTPGMPPVNQPQPAQQPNPYNPGILPPGYQYVQQQPVQQQVPDPNYNPYNPQLVVGPIGQRGPTQAQPQGQGGGNAGVQHVPQRKLPPNELQQ